MAVLLVVGYSMTAMGITRYRQLVTVLDWRSLSIHRPVSLGRLTSGLVALEAAIAAVIVRFWSRQPEAAQTSSASGWPRSHDRAARSPRTATAEGC